MVFCYKINCMRCNELYALVSLLTAMSTLEETLKLTPVSSSRMILGYIDESTGYRYTSSRSAALAHCTLLGYLELLRVCHAAGLRKPVALWRGHSLQFKFVNIQLYSYGWHSDYVLLFVSEQLMYSKELTCFCLDALAKLHWMFHYLQCSYNTMLYCDDFVCTMCVI